LTLHVHDAKFALRGTALSGEIPGRAVWLGRMGSRSKTSEAEGNSGRTVQAVATGLQGIESQIRFYSTQVSRLVRV